MKLILFFMALILISSCGSDSGSSQNQETRTEITSQESIEQFTKELNAIRVSSAYQVKYTYDDNCVFTNEGIEVELKSSKYTDDSITYSRETKNTQTSECGPEENAKTFDYGKIDLYLDAANLNYYCIEKAFKKSETLFELERCNSKGTLLYNKSTKTISFKYRSTNRFGDEFNAEETYRTQEQNPISIKAYLAYVTNFNIYEYNDSNKSYEKKEVINTKNAVEDLFLDL